MMFKKLIICLTFAPLIGLLTPSHSDAGPLLDWMLGRNRYRCNQPVQYGSNYNAAAIAASANGQLQPGVCQVNCQRTCQRVVVNYVPQTCYRTKWQQVPVTSYRPVTNTDPCSGCTVTCMRPCTSYTWQAQRVPYTTYRPVYRTETYKVPVTYYTSDCANPTAACTSCNQSGNSTGVFGNGGIVPQPTTVNPNTTLNPSTLNGTQSVLGNAADSIPTINPTASQRPVYQPNYPSPSSLQNLPTLQTAPTQTLNQPPGNSTRWQEEPNLIPADKQAHADIRRQWNYEPVRLASYAAPVESSAAGREYTADVRFIPKSSSTGSSPPSGGGGSNPNAHWDE